MPEKRIAISVTELSKRFGGGLGGSEVIALSDVSLSVNAGEAFGLLGPNGAGKTTLVKILLGLLRASCGGGQVNGHDISSYKARGKVGFLPENHHFPNYLTGYQMLRVYGGMSGCNSVQIKARSSELLELVGMTRWRNMRIKKYSKGMMQRLGLAQAMINNPDILFLDEPTDGVDPIGRREIRDVLINFKNQGKTIFLNSHLLSEVEHICGRVAILDKGKLIKEGPIDQLVHVQPGYQIDTCELPFEAAEKVKSAYPNSSIKDNGILVRFDDKNQVNSLIDLLRRLDINIISVVPVKSSLEDSFMQLIRKGESVD